ncbi:hypothetical protein F5Y16DRAFT_415128 [Xylariaceae sp. FL0255]|nr:hypothetical protein F5Y16DRAFT_415128 [Xylariaceae sp. FL0255]
MVGLIEREKKPKPPIVLGSPPKEGLARHQPASGLHRRTTHTVQNFSYPTRVSARYLASSAATSQEQGPSTWDQLGEICTFSSDSASRTGRVKTPGLRDPFFYTTERASYDQPVDQEDRVHPKTNISARLKRNSLGRHKASSSFDAARVLFQPPDNPERPLSSSGVPLIDKRLKHCSASIPITAIPPSFSLGKDAKDLSTSTGLREASGSHTMPTSRPFQMDKMWSRNGSSQGFQGENVESHDFAENRSLSTRSSVSVSTRNQEGKSGWFTQLKKWMSVSEPSTQALKNYKHQTYKKAGVALDDPQANAKLHLPVGTLPPEAVRPGGRGPDPEEIALHRAAQRRKARESLCLTSTSQGSRSSASHYSSSSSVGGTKDGV